ncbi:MAG TPA: hypothetical protein VI356_03880 [Myxococcales bacterium]
MLSDEEKDRIRAEEIFRSEVRRELARATPTPPLRKRVWLVLNSAFSLWFFSSVVLAGLTAAVAAHQRSRDERNRNETLRRRLVTEIDGRILEAIEGMHVDEKRIEAGQYFPASSIYAQAAAYLDNFFRNDPSNPRDFSTYPEFAQRTFRSLISELRSVQDPKGLDEVVELFKQLAVGGSVEGNAPTGKPTREETETAIKRSIQVLQRLRDNPSLHSS